ncbi:MAG: hypothetical protein NVSMB59_08960 [Vulcanimicrobiaceae bacterium]
MMKLAVVLGALFAAAGAVTARSDIELPTEFHVSAPTMPAVETGTLPQGAARTADGAHLVVVEDGVAAPAARVYDTRTLALQRTIPLVGAFGSPLADVAGDAFWVSLAGSDAIAHASAATGTLDRRIALPRPFWASAIVRSPDGKTLAVSGEAANAVRFIDERSGTVGPAVRVGAHPFGLAYGRDGRTLYVANWGDATVSAIDTATRSVRATIAVGRHPEALALSHDGARFYVSETDDDSIGVVDTATCVRASGISLNPFGLAVSGASPTALAISSDGTRLYVTESAVNAIAAIDIGGGRARVVGTLPTGWYPTAIVISSDGTTLDVVDGKGEASRPNPQFRPFASPRDDAGYVARGLLGSIRRIALPDDASIAAATVRATGGAVASAPPSSIVRANGPIAHVIYVVRENRSFDQILGDVAGANGDPKLALFGANVTPNAHALAARFGVLDDTTADAAVSADGHNWTLGAFANDYLERMWPPIYGGRRKTYDLEDNASAATPHNGYLWNSAKRANVTVRNYGEFTTAVAMTPQPNVVSHMKDLADVTDPRFPGFDLDFSDLDRYAEWKREFDGYVRAKNLPQLEIVRLPNDHTAATRPGALTPAAYVAQNDLALGKLVEAVSHSPYWRDTVILVLEDDAQNGADHVDAQRMPAFVISAYSAGGVVHRHHSTAGFVHTIDALLDLPPLSVYDATTATLADAFAPGGKADVRPYDARPARVDLGARNAATAYRARESASLDLSREDAVPIALMRDILAHVARAERR